MTITEMAMNMYPFWIVGIIIMVATYFSEFKNLLRVQWKEVGEWAKLLGIMTLARIVVFALFGEHFIEQVAGASSMPWQVSLTVFWEDAFHTLPIVILSKILGNDKKWKKWMTYGAIGVMMVVFGLGHTYQGMLAAAALSLYVPFTFHKGQEVGFGTVMLCHMMYDLVTILTIQHFLLG